MSPGDFLRAVWPSEGLYCLATPWVTPDGVRVYAHKVCHNISDAVSFVLAERGSKDVYFAVHTLQKPCVWNPQKLNRKTGEHGANEIRVQRNMAAAKCFFFDIDVGAAADKYSTQGEALAALISFCAACKLPRPLVVSSGGGLHVYWLIGEVLESEEWRVHAGKLRQLARHHGLKIDGSRTTDTASVLRVAGTLNFKNRAAPRPVDALPTNPATTPTGVFVKQVDDALTLAGLEAKAPPKFDAIAHALGSNTAREYEGPPVSLRAVASACKQMQRLIIAQGNVSEPEWYHGVIGIGRFLEDGHRRVHQLSQGYPGYSVAATAAKIKQHEERRDAAGNALGPTSCGKLAEVSGAGDEPCVGCPFVGKVQGPLGAARFKDPAPQPVVSELVGATTVITEIPDAPAPYIRLKGGGIAINAKDAAGEETHTIIYPYDLYPVRRLVNVAAGIEQHLWHVDLPRSETKEFVLDADALYDSRKFVVAISHQGLYPAKGHIPYLQDYMVAYISALQKLTDADAQCGHLGWTDEYERFILPDKVLLKDGTARPAMLSLGAQRASLNVTKKGDLATQIKLMSFYNHPDYIPNQFFVLAGLAAPIFFATGHHGVIVNASGDAGASKSTSLYTASSFWGQPELYPINGTNNGATVRGRNERITVLANLPICVDEITHMPVRDAIDLAMSVTQPGHRIRLGTDGVERASIESYKATIMLTTANASLHAMLSTDNSAGTAGSMRVFEIGFEKASVHTKAQADDYLHQLKQNFGHIGELIVIHVLKNLETVKERVRQVTRELDTAVGIQSSERFWSALAAAVIVIGEIAISLGLLPYDVAAIRRWVLDKQIPYMRGVVVEEYSDPLSVVADYLETINGNILVVQKVDHPTMNNLTSISNEPRGALLAHYDVTKGVLYVLKKAFKDHCARIGANSIKILEELSKVDAGGSPVVANAHAKRTLGAGTDLAKAQSWCFVINMTHPDVRGTIDLSVITGTPDTSALRVAQ